jgi:tRNA modification GTPase
MLEETIAAIATPPGEGGIGIIRISGEEAKTILDKVFVPVNANSLENRKMAYGNIVEPSSTSQSIDRHYYPCE